MQAAIRVFRAVPDRWPNAVFHNLRTAGAFLVSAVREGGRTQRVRVHHLRMAVSLRLESTLRPRGRPKKE